MCACAQLLPARLLLAAVRFVGAGLPHTCCRQAALPLLLLRGSCCRRHDSRLPSWRCCCAQVLACPADAEAILPWIKWFQSMIR